MKVVAALRTIPISARSAVNYPQDWGHELMPRFLIKKKTASKRSRFPKISAPQCRVSVNFNPPIGRWASRPRPLSSAVCYLKVGKPFASEGLRPDIIRAYKQSRLSFVVKYYLLFTHTAGSFCDEKAEPCGYSIVGKAQKINRNGKNIFHKIFVKGIDKRRKV